MSLEAVILDFDDTIVDTFGSLITPLETEAANEMVAAGMGDVKASEVVELILRLRKEEPDRIEERLVERFPEARGRALEARRKVFARASPDRLQIKPTVKDMLCELAKRYDTFLLTTGRTDFQNRKLDNMDIRPLFKEVIVLASRSEETKERWLASLIERGYNSQAIVVVGNRLDNEIKAGHRLGMMTVWMKYGEGSGLVPCADTGQPDYVIYDIAEFPEVLALIEKGRVHS